MKKIKIACVGLLWAISTISIMFINSPINEYLSSYVRVAKETMFPSQEITIGWILFGKVVLSMIVTGIYIIMPFKNGIQTIKTNKTITFWEIIKNKTWKDRRWMFFMVTTSGIFIINIQNSPMAETCLGNMLGISVIAFICLVVCLLFWVIVGHLADTAFNSTTPEMVIKD